MSKYTQGKWIAAPDPHGIVEDWMVGVEGGMPDQVAVCSECDAHLIAAAPDMLQALQAYDAWADKTPPHDKELRALREQMRAAILKATGAT